MRRFIFAALSVGVAMRGIEGQQVPARELLEFPITVMAEAPALARLVAGGLWNPAAIGAAPGGLGLASAAALNTPIAQGVAAQHVGVSFPLRRGRLLGTVSFTHASVSDLVRTGPDPSEESLGGDIPYATAVYSAGLAWRRATTLVGAALRYRRGHADAEHRSALAADVGVLAERAFGTPLRIGVSTFLLNGSGADREPFTLLAAAELPLRADSITATAVGYSYQRTQRLGEEHYVYGSARWRRLDARAGMAEYHGLASRTRRLRLGLGLQYARYLVGLAREESGAGLGASYQFTLTAMFK
ncbi:MAG TPA: hypothetical protein VEA99_13610 [Gemmatimonadaceae bacterium]|nr:hypothetical protein [Gemmatimonadaceae bacterium]